ncbi:hypothetical protein FGO68_gene15320 [Halteria grandinella]|uniref:Uncharacterized protein n=1 Tax=Halteria grandinella TaxID=5974 RepID=A0A8J8NGF3_HALGN|nr:hypothetical protein FGO68_gene15320 [Halteria grandinella]
MKLLVTEPQKVCATKKRPSGLKPTYANQYSYAPETQNCLPHWNGVVAARSQKTTSGYEKSQVTKQQKLAESPVNSVSVVLPAAIKQFSLTSIEQISVSDESPPTTSGYRALGQVAVHIK